MRGSQMVVIMKAMQKISGRSWCGRGRESNSEDLWPQLVCNVGGVVLNSTSVECQIDMAP